MSEARRGAARPFVPWVGGKTAILPALLGALPERYDGYCEPFAGGGAMLFALPAIPRRHVADANPYLVNAYRWVAGDVESVIKHLAAVKPPQSEVAYRDLVAECLRTTQGSRGAALFIATVKTTWGAKWEIDAHGNHTGSWSKRPTRLCNPAALRRCAAHLQGAVFHSGDFRSVLETVDLRTGDFVYLDPPYLPERVGTFTQYLPDGFGVGDHVELASWIAGQGERGVRVMLSMNDTDQARNIYHGLRFRSVTAPRRLNVRDRIGTDLVGMNY